ncbi:MAG TPA: hypothetical protein VJG32_04115 [Anaerolineae bacterium]|nr:hypothetical protein [Anaerolineae bacterium]
MRISRGALVWGLTLIVLGVLLFAQNQGWLRVSFSFWVWACGGLGVLFLLTALTNWSLWGALFPGFVLLGMAAVIYLSESTTASGNLVGSVFLSSIALPFWIVALIRRANWWAIIPAGVITVLASMPLLSETRLSGQAVGGIFFLGLGITFGLVRLRTIGQSGMGWAWYPALILSAIGLVVLASGDPQVWPFVFIGAGVVLLIRSLIPARRPPLSSTEPDAKG